MLSISLKHFQISVQFVNVKNKYSQQILQVFIALLSTACVGLLCRLEAPLFSGWWLIDRLLLSLSSRGRLLLVDCRCRLANLLMMFEAMSLVPRIGCILDCVGCILHRV